MREGLGRSKKRLKGCSEGFKTWEGARDCCSEGREDGRKGFRVVGRLVGSVVGRLGCEQIYSIIYLQV